MQLFGPFCPKSLTGHANRLPVSANSLHPTLHDLNNGVYRCHSSHTGAGNARPTCAKLGVSSGINGQYAESNWCGPVKTLSPHWHATPIIRDRCIASANRVNCVFLFRLILAPGRLDLWGSHDHTPGYRAGHLSTSTPIRGQP